MGYVGQEGGTPVVLTGTPSSNGDLFGGSGGFGGFLLGTLLSGGNGLFGGMNNRLGYGAGMGYPGAGGYYAGNVEGGQTGALSGLQSQVSQISNVQGQDRVLGEVNAVENSIHSLNSSVCGGFADVQSSLASIGRDYNNLFGQVNSNIASGNFTTLGSINDLGRDVTAQANNNALQQLNSFNVLGTNMNQNFNAMNTQTQTGFNNVSNATQTGFNNLNTTTLTGFNNAAFNNQASFNNTNTLLNQGINEINRDMSTATSQIIAGQNSLAAQMAHCCCDIKETIKCDGGLTRQLINDIRLAELNAALTDAKVEVSNLQQTNSLNSNNAAQTSTILAHITPLMQAILSSNNSRHGGDDRRS